MKDARQESADICFLWSGAAQCCKAVQQALEAK